MVVLGLCGSLEGHCGKLIAQVFHPRLCIFLGDQICWQVKSQGMVEKQAASDTWKVHLVIIISTSAVTTITTFKKKKFLLICLLQHKATKTQQQQQQQKAMLLQYKTTKTQRQK